MRSNRTLLLSDETIRQLVGVKDAITAVEKAFRLSGEGRTQMPAKLCLCLNRFQGDYRAMPAQVEEPVACGLKWVSVYPGNRKKRLPSVMGLMILNDPATGFPLCIMNAAYATALRTAAAGAVAAKYLARKDSSRVALIGCGTQARYQLLALMELFPVSEVHVWGQGEEAKQFIRNMGLKNTIMTPAVSIQQAVTGADIVVTTTPSRKPLVQRAWLKKDAHVNAIGADAPGKQELDPEILRHSLLVVDSREQAVHSGEINVAWSQGLLTQKNIAADIGQIVTGKKKGRTSTTGLTVFDSTGLAIQDIALASVIYRKALRYPNPESMVF